MKRSIDISDSLASADWGLIAYTLAHINNGIKPKDAASRRLRAQTGIVRIILYEKIKGWNGRSSLDLSFFIAMFKTIQKMEKEFDALEVREREFLIFLKLLLYKFEKQKLIVKKPFANRSEFKKMKEVVENESGPL